ncbi:MAG: site-2 protease family protein, partial [Acetatifactor sp.]|nr:site-2 protease family protein [Acetatifactor sp.]
MTFILFFLIFGVVVISHEFGHYLIAKSNGIHVVEFAIGMGPTIFSWKKKETKYSVKLLPLGGACMFEGEDGLNTQEGEITEGSFLQAKVWARISTVLAGPIFNFILGAIIAVILSGIMVFYDPVVADVTEGGPAQLAGLQAGDVITALNGDRVYLREEVLLFNRVNNGKEFTLEYEREGQRYTVAITPVPSGGGYVMGIHIGEALKVKGLDVLKYAWYEIRYCVRSTWQSLGLMLRGQVKSDEVAGPVGIAVNVVGKTYTEAKQYGWQTVALNMGYITLLLTINLGILNLLPIPALDGGRLVFLLVEVIRGKPVPPEKEGMVHFIGLVFFMILMVIV